ncbi:MAG: HD domain-containing protein [Spirochaetales bacterium]|nr:HD domain-containing protein [Spirochaetales bacterium]
MAIDISERLEKQLAFIRELDKLKSVKRRTYLLDSSRTENSAEHSWQVALMAILLIEHADADGIDPFRVVKMLLIHDVVEIEAGDTYIYDERAVAGQAKRETRASEKLFGLLPGDQRDELLSLWREFEEGVTPAARFAKSIDRFQPLYHNFLTSGKAWLEHGIDAARVRANVEARIGDGSAELGELAGGLIDEAAVRGYLAG